MLVAVVSDSHNNSEAVDLAKKAIAKCDALLFLGDGESDLEKLTEGFKGEVSNSLVNKHTGVRKVKYMLYVAIVTLR